MAPQLTPSEKGWFEWKDGARKGTKVLVKVDEAKDGRFNVTGLRIDGTVSAELLRSLPVGRIEATANAQLHGGVDKAARGGRSKPQIAAKLRKSTPQGYTDAFYDAVAIAYRGLVGTSSRPIGELATANEVPVTTAQRWVREARRRGKLPPGRPGKAG